MRVVAHVPRERLVQLTQEAHKAGVCIEDYIRGKLATVFAVPGTEIHEVTLEPRPNPVTRAARDYFHLCRAPHTRQGDSLELPHEPGTFTVIVD